MLNVILSDYADWLRTCEHPSAKSRPPDRRAERDRVTRSMMDGITIIQRVADRGATVKVLDKPWLDLTTTVGKGILAFLSALAEDERDRISRRANEGRAAAKARGVKFGPRLNISGVWLFSGW